MKQSLRLGSVRGIALGVHWSVGVILVLFAWELAEYQLPADPGHAGVGDWVAGVVGAVALLASLLAHELSHALVARRSGVRVRSITLFVFGGLTQLEGEAHTPGADFRIAAVGPATSLVLAGVLGGADALARVGSVHGLPTATLSWLWEVNLLLAGFNLVPAAPLDGGRILRAALWRHWGNRTRAALASTRVGRWFGVLLVFLGVLGVLAVGITGLWAALIGVFLYASAVSEEQYELVEDALSGLTVGEVMFPDPPTVLPSTSGADLLALFQWRYRGDAVVVTDPIGAAPAGVVTTRVMRRIEPEQQRTADAGHLAVPLAELVRCRPEEPAGPLLPRIAAHGGHPAVVFDSTGRLVGLVSLADLERAAAWATARRRRTLLRR